MYVIGRTLHADNHRVIAHFTNNQAALIAQANLHFFDGPHYQRRRHPNPLDELTQGRVRMLLRGQLAQIVNEQA